jgi:hypothetical protein
MLTTLYCTLDNEQYTLCNEECCNSNGRSNRCLRSVSRKHSRKAKPQSGRRHGDLGYRTKSRSIMPKRPTVSAMGKIHNYNYNGIIQLNNASPVQQMVASSAEPSFPIHSPNRAMWPWSARIWPHRQLVETLPSCPVFPHPLVIKDHSPHCQDV